MDLQTYITALPKAELHLHIEGSLEPEMMFELARRNGVALPYASVEETRAAYAFTDLQSFLDIYYAGAAVLVHERDFFELAMAYFERAKADGVVHAELFFDPQTHTARGIAFGTVLDGLERACREAQERHGISSRLILCFLRHLPEEEAFATLEEAKPHLHRIHGIGLDSSEKGHPPAKHARVFAACRELGLRLVAHAGEEGPAANVRDALDLLQVQRIDHGVRAIEDPALVA
ncbi:MAG TPA: adenosine deaminase, partial [Holophaga sp.]|nr:adenosine deaminase [Holophaga sp.]